MKMQAHYPLFRTLTLCVALGLSSGGAAAQSRPWLDTSASSDARAAALVGQMTLEEKAAQMQNAAPAIERLGVPAYAWWNEGLHGVARAGQATVFPQAIGLAATFDVPLMGQVATTISDEARAKHHQFIREGQHGRYQGLTFWSPNINIFRDPRWGRGQETYGEDPYLTARMGVAFVQGLQGDDPVYRKLDATAKHFAVHSGPEADRHHFDARPSKRVLYDTYFPAFEALVKEGDVDAVMGAYNRVYGESASASQFLLRDVLRRDWGFKGYVVSDCWAIVDIWKHHKIVPSREAAAALAVKNGTELECGQEYATLPEAVRQGLISEAEIDDAVTRLFAARMRLGMFDPPEKVRWARIPASVNQAPAHDALALKAAQESLVLLKNDGALPLSRTLKRIAVVGPTADDTMALLGNYFGTPAAPVTVLQGIRDAAKGIEVRYARGVDLVEGRDDPAATPLIEAAYLRPAADSPERGFAASISAARTSPARRRWYAPMRRSGSVGTVVRQPTTCWRVAKPRRGRAFPTTASASVGLASCCRRCRDATGSRRRPTTAIVCTSTESRSSITGPAVIACVAMASNWTWRPGAPMTCDWNTSMPSATPVYGWAGACPERSLLSRKHWMRPAVRTWWCSWVV